MAHKLGSTMTILFCIFTVIIAAIVAMWIKLLDFANASIAGSLFNVVCIPTFSRGTKEMINPCLIYLPLVSLGLHPDLLPHLRGSRREAQRHREHPAGAGTPQHGLSSQNMALITSDCGATRAPRASKWP